MKYELESMQNVTEEKKNYREKKKKEKKERVPLWPRDGPLFIQPLP